MKHLQVFIFDKVFREMITVSLNRIKQAEPSLTLPVILRDIHKIEPNPSFTRQVIYRKISHRTNANDNSPLIDKKVWRMKWICLTAFGINPQKEK